MPRHLKHTISIESKKNSALSMLATTLASQLSHQTRNDDFYRKKKHFIFLTRIYKFNYLRFINVSYRFPFLRADCSSGGSSRLMLFASATILLLLHETSAICRSGQPSLATRSTSGVCMLQNTGCCTAADDTAINAQLTAFGTGVSAACKDSLRQILCVVCDHDAAMAYTSPNPNAMPRLCQIECEPIYNNCRNDVVSSPPWGGSGTLGSRFATWNAFCESIGSADGSTCATFSRGIFPKTVVFKSGEQWKYAAAASATGFETDSFDDSAFASGNSPLGFNAANASATFGTRLPTTTRSTVFRKFVNIVAGEYLLLVRGYLRVASDDGAAVYFNGKLLGSDETANHANANWNSEFIIEKTDIKSGTNLVAVRVANDDASALYFDAEMVFDNAFVPYTALAPTPMPAPVPTIELQRRGERVGQRRGAARAGGGGGELAHAELGAALQQLAGGDELIVGLLVGDIKRVRAARAHGAKLRVHVVLRRDEQADAVAASGATAAATAARAARRVAAPRRINHLVGRRQLDHRLRGALVLDELERALEHELLPLRVEAGDAQRGIGGGARLVGREVHEAALGENLVLLRHADRVAVQAVADGARKAKVAQLDLPVRVDEQILRLDVAVNQFAPRPSSTRRSARRCCRGRTRAAARFRGESAPAPCRPSPRSS
jgi:hypothetical protein